MPTTAYTDGSFVYPSQHGARQVSLPLIPEQEYYCTQTVRQMQQLSQFWEPSMYQRTAYTNILTYSDSLSNSAWTKLAVTVAAEEDTDPEGGDTAAMIAETTANSAHSVSQAASGTGVVTFGAFIKAKERTFVRLRINNATDGDLAIAIFNLTLGKVESGTGTIKKMPGGWLYCTVSGTATVSGNTCYLELASNATTTSYAGTTGSSLYAWRLNAVFASSVSPVPATTAATPAIYTQSVAVEATVPLVDADDPLSFLVDETPPDQSTLELGVCQWQRTFCRVSRQTTVPSSIIVSKPAPLGSGSTILGTDVFFHQPESAYSTYDIYSVADVDFDYGMPAFTISSGTYTLTVGSYTTASINYNATAGDVQDALNAIPSVVSAGLATVTGSATVGAGFTVIFGASATYGYLDPSVGLGSLTPNGGVFVGQGGGTGGTGPTDPYRLYEIVGPNGASITGGTYALTFPLGGDTTSTLDYDATSAEIGVALNALASVTAIGGITMYDGPQGPSGYDPISKSIKISFYFSTPTITGNVTLLQPPPVTLLVTLEPNRYGRKQYVFLSAGNNTRLLTSESHGISTGDTIFLEASYVSATSPATVYSTTYYVPVTNFTVNDSDNIGLLGTPLDGYMTAATITKVGRRTFTGYSPGPQNVRARKITDYYLPGFTPGIATFEDIPVIDSQNDGEPFFAALLAGGDINYVVGEIGVWRGPIIYQSVVKIAATALASYSEPFEGGSLYFQPFSSETASFPTIAQYAFNNFTFEIWVYINSTPTPDQFGRIVNHPSGVFNIQYRTGTKLVFESSLFTVQADNGSATLDEWDHYAFRREGSTFTILKNGVSIKAQSVSTSVLDIFGSASDIINFGGTSENVEGRVSDWRMWARAVPDAEILANYQSRLQGNESGLVCYYKLSQSNNVFIDSTGLNAAPLTLNLANWVSDGPFVP